VDEDGHEVEFELAPALPPADIELLADQAGVPLPCASRAPPPSVRMSEYGSSSN